MRAHWVIPLLSLLGSCRSEPPRPVKVEAVVPFDVTPVESPPSAGAPAPVTSWAPAQGCATTCDRARRCGVGPFSSREDCALACEAAEDSPATAATFGCLARASGCEVMRACDGRPRPMPPTATRFVPSGPCTTDTTPSNDRSLRDEQFDLDGDGTPDLLTWSLDDCGTLECPKTVYVRRAACLYGVGTIDGAPAGLGPEHAGLRDIRTRVGVGADQVDTQVYRFDGRSYQPLTP